MAIFSARTRNRCFTFPAGASSAMRPGQTEFSTGSTRAEGRRAEGTTRRSTGRNGPPLFPLAFATSSLAGDSGPGSVFRIGDLLMPIPNRHELLLRRNDDEALSPCDVKYPFVERNDLQRRRASLGGR